MVVDITTRTADRWLDSQPREWLVASSHTEVVTLVVVTLYSTCFIVVTYREIRLKLVRTTRDRYVIILSKTSLCCQIPPAEVAVAEVLVPTGKCDFVSISERCIIIVQFCTVHNFQVTVIYVADTHLNRCVYVHLTFAALLGSYHDNTIRTFRTVDSCRSSILQYSHGFDISRIQVTSAATYDNTVDNPQWLCTTAQRSLTTDYYRTTGTRLARTRSYVYTRNLTVQHIFYRRSSYVLQLVALNCSHRTSQAFLTLSGVTYYDYFVQSFCVFSQLDSLLLSSCLYFDSLVTDERHYQSRTYWSVEFVVTIEVSDSTIGSTLYKNVGTDDRFTVLIQDSTLDLCSLLCHSWL